MNIEELLKVFPGPQEVLPGGGYVMVLDVMGDDRRVVRAARHSYGFCYGNPDPAGEKPIEGTLRYMMRHGHGSPFEMPTIYLEIKAPLPTARQAVRHRIGASWNEVSARYTEMPDEHYTPPLHRIQKNDKLNKQGSGEPFTRSEAIVIRDELINGSKRATESYERVLKKGLSMETARNCMPLSQMTTWVWKLNARSLLHFLKQRMDSHAQWEIRQYANKLAEIFEAWMPETYRAFMDYEVNGMKLSRMEVEALRDMITDVAAHNDFTPELLEGEYSKRKDLSAGERREFLVKLKRLTAF